MDYTKLLSQNKISKLGIVGASDGFGYTTLVQIRYVKQIDIRVVCALELDECYNALVETGYNESVIKICNNITDIENTNPDDIIVVNDYNLVLECGVTSILEATGNIVIGTDITEKALSKGINVYMVSKETDSFSGPYFNQLAKKNNTVYALINGDQPRNLNDLYSWGQLVGLDIIAAGKSSEYDFVYDKITKNLTYTDGKNEYVEMPDLEKFLNYKDRSTLDARYKLLKDKANVIAADVCEMNTVSNVTGLVPSKNTLSYPIIKTTELADVFIPKEEGGILEKTGVVDVFYQLRETNESSFAGGVFLVFKIENEKLMDLLRSKGHIISRNGKYGCIFQPYHMMGLESPLSIILGDREGVGTRPDTRQVSIMAGMTEKEFSKGTTFEVYGHHHEIKGIQPQLYEKDEAQGAVPFYLLNSMTLNKDIKKGHLITIDDIDLNGNRQFEIYNEGLSI